jgi:regulator of replication initiation timing
MLTNIINYEPKTDWQNNCKVDMNIRDLQKHYPSGCRCCGKFYANKDFSRLIAKHFITAKHDKTCLAPANEKFLTDFKDVSDINRDFEEKCKEVRYLKEAVYSLRDENQTLKNKLAFYMAEKSINLIDI